MDTLNIKKCNTCKISKPLSEFYKRLDGVQHMCKECTRTYNKQRWADGHSRLTYEQSRRAKLKHRYGITLEEYDVLLEKQEGLCAVCKVDLSTLSSKEVVVDHSHSTKEVRGILCTYCNSALGYFKDDPTRMREAAEYVERYNS